MNGKVLRIITRQGLYPFQAFLASAVARSFVSRDRVVRTQILDEAEVQDLYDNAGFQTLLDGVDLAMLVEHERVPFQSFPYEWPPELLYAAAELTLELAEGLLTDRLGLKDATPFNVLFRGTEPVFIDVLSFEQRQAGDPIWLPYAQFVRTFITPLLLYKYFGLLPSVFFLGRRDGLEPEEVYKLGSPVRRFAAAFSDTRIHS